MVLNYGNVISVHYTSKTNLLLKYTEISQDTDSTKRPSEAMDYKKLYEHILNIHPNIRFVTIVDIEGRLMAGGQRSGISNYLTPEEERQSIRHAIDAWKLRQVFTGSIGHGKYALVEYDKIKRITIPINSEHLIYMTTEVNVNHAFVINEILKIVEVRDKTIKQIS